MHYSKNALATFCSIDTDPDILAHIITTHTCEVEEITQRVIPDGVVIGYVTAIHDHPNADKLRVCTINIGNDQSLSISTGATNIVTNIYVAVATPGTYLPAIDLHIKPREMRGVMSYGMICSLQELGIDDTTDGIRIMNDDIDLTISDVGKPLAKCVPWLANTIRHVENKTITNRPDLTGHFGLAVELVTILSLDTLVHTEQYKRSKITRRVVDDTKNIYTIDTPNTLYNAATSAPYQPRIDTSSVRSYCTIMCNDVQVRPSDLYTRIMLQDMGGSSTLNWIDMSNIFMFLFGQPIHCYDADTVVGTICARHAHPDESFTDLNGTVHTLHPDDIVIADDTKILSLGGVIGGYESRVTQKTTNIIIEYANFDPIAVRKTAQRHNLRTDASMRFEKNISPTYSYAHIHVLTTIVDRFIGKEGYTFGGVSEMIAHEYAHAHPAISCNINDIITSISPSLASLTPQVCYDILSGLGYACSINSDKPMLYTVTPPIRRSPDDSTLPADIVEEIARIYGYEHIPSIPFRDTSHIRNDYHYTRWHVCRNLENIFVHECHADMIETYPWSDTDITTHITSFPPSPWTIRNPARPQASNLRSSLIPNLLHIIHDNQAIIDTGRLAEIGSCWYTPEQTQNATHTAGNIDLHHDSEHLHAAICIYGNVAPFSSHISTHYEQTLWAQLISLRHRIHERYDIPQHVYSIIPTSHIDHHPHQQAIIMHGSTQWGCLGVLHPYSLQNANINVPVGYLEIMLHPLIEYYHTTSHTQTSYTTRADTIVIKDVTCTITPKTDIRSLIDNVKHITNVICVHFHDLYTPEHEQPRVTCRLGIAIDDTKKTDTIVQNVLRSVRDHMSSHNATLYGHID